MGPWNPLWTSPKRETHLEIISDNPQKRSAQMHKIKADLWSIVNMYRRYHKNPRTSTTSCPTTEPLKPEKTSWRARRWPCEALFFGEGNSLGERSLCSAVVYGSFLALHHLQPCKLIGGSRILADFLSLYIFLYIFTYFYVYLHTFCMLLCIFLDFLV